MKLVMHGATRVVVASVEAAVAAATVAAVAAMVAVEAVVVVAATVVEATTVAAVAATEVAVAAMVVVVVVETVAVAAIEVAAMVATITIVETRAEKTGEIPAVASMVDLQAGATKLYLQGISAAPLTRPRIAQVTVVTVTVTVARVDAPQMDLPHSPRAATISPMDRAAVEVVVLAPTSAHRVIKVPVNFRLLKATRTTRHLATHLRALARGVEPKVQALEETEVVAAVTPSTSRKTLRACAVKEDLSAVKEDLSAVKEDLLLTLVVLRLKAKARVLSRLSTCAISITRRLRTR